MQTEIGSERATMVTVVGPRAADAFRAAATWLERHPHVSVMGTDHAYEPEDLEGRAVSCPHVLRLTVVGAEADTEDLRHCSVATKASS
ncbi:hypothetical protein [Saccharopolyspora shandongensis]|uniref:hypothetical protein n=1 Tax=Saccharopolyspora shandongensis TaxID=418495 RepID=UPI0033FECA4B